MASLTLVHALRRTADRLRTDCGYEWGHVGRCNCGHLIQTLTDMNEHQIYRLFGQEVNEWTEHANDYCETTNTPVIQLFNSLAAVGFSRKDVEHLEYLSDQRVLRALPSGRRHLRRNSRADVIEYMETLADVLEEPLAA